MQNIFRKIIYFLLALAAISVLGFLYIKGLDFSIARQQNAAEKLRDLRQLDADMDAGVLRTNVGLVGDYDPLAEAMIAMQTSTDALSLDYQWEGADPTLLRNVKQQVEEKTASMFFWFSPTGSRPSLMASAWSNSTSRTFWICSVS